MRYLSVRLMPTFCSLLALLIGLQRRLPDELPVMQNAMLQVVI